MGIGVTGQKDCNMAKKLHSRLAGDCNAIVTGDCNTTNPFTFMGLYKKVTFVTLYCIHSVKRVYIQPTHPLYPHYQT